MSIPQNLLLFLAFLFAIPTQLVAQNGGYEKIRVTNNTDDAICISLQWDKSGPTCDAQGTPNAYSYGTVNGGGNTLDVLPQNPGYYITTVRIFNDACANSCLTPTIMDLGPGSGTYSATYVHCSSGNTNSVTVTFSPAGGGTNCSSSTATISLDY